MKYPLDALSCAHYDSKDSPRDHYQWIDGTMISTVTTSTVTTITTIITGIGLFASISAMCLITFLVLVVAREVLGANSSRWSGLLRQGSSIALLPLGLASAMLLWFNLSQVL